MGEGGEAIAAWACRAGEVIGKAGRKHRPYTQSCNGYVGRGRESVDSCTGSFSRDADR